MHDVLDYFCITLNPGRRSYRHNNSIALVCPSFHNRHDLCCDIFTFGQWRVALSVQGGVSDISRCPKLNARRHQLKPTGSDVWPPALACGRCLARSPRRIKSRCSGGKFSIALLDAHLPPHPPLISTVPLSSIRTPCLVSTIRLPSPLRSLSHNT